MKRLLPCTGHYLTLRHGARCHYLDEGQGAPVVLLHGNPSWCFYYRHLVLALRAEHRVIVPDHIGCGLSDKPGDHQYRYSLDQRLADLEELLDHLDLKQPISLVLHDWGGMIGMAYATRHPERIDRLVLLNTAAFHLPASKKLPTALRLGRDSRIGSLLIRGFNAFSRGAAWIGCKRQPMPAALRSAYCAPYNSWANRIATLRFVQDIPLGPGDAAYAEVSRVEQNLHLLADRPILIGWGERDFVFDRHFLQQWQQHFPNAELHRWPDAGHYILEDAADELIPLIRDFLCPGKEQAA
ncbi:MAG: alpha/beta fold hydrolase [Desulfuromonas sp.]